MAEPKVMRDISLNEPITVEAPCYMWVALIAAYNDTEWSNGNLSEILTRAQRQILDPIYLREQEAAMQEQQDVQHAAFQQFTRLLPGMPIVPEAPDDEQPS